MIKRNNLRVPRVISATQSEESKILVNLQRNATTNFSSHFHKPQNNASSSSSYHDESATLVIFKKQTLSSLQHPSSSIISTMAHSSQLIGKKDVKRKTRKTNAQKRVKEQMEREAHALRKRKNKTLKEAAMEYQREIEKTIFSILLVPEKVPEPLPNKSAKDTVPKCATSRFSGIPPRFTAFRVRRKSMRSRTRRKSEWKWDSSTRERGRL